MATAVEQMVGWVTDLHSQIGQQLFGLGNRISNWLILGNVGALVLLFNAKLETDFVVQQDARQMALFFCIGLGAAFLGIVITFVTSTIAYGMTTAALSALGSARINQQYIDELEAEGIVIADDAPLNKNVEEAEQNFNKLGKHMPKLWVGIGLACLAYGASAAAFAAGVTLPFY